MVITTSKIRDRISPDTIIVSNKFCLTKLDSLDNSGVNTTKLNEMIVVNKTFIKIARIDKPSLILINCLLSLSNCTPEKYKDQQ